ncbi:CRISPR-associated endonuclease Cas1 [Thermopolyspora sp. NPDC052614]|uniref:CRISPR-associated endonuclease Cas1 n=1 Tax=Thermopolyspora sp. NPDC052614 TaxID=3155682 RepID=UPI00341E4573
MTTPHASKDLIPISLIAHQVFCPRRAWLEAMGERTDTGQMAIGTRDHASVDDHTSSRATRLRSLEVISERLNIVGRCDLVEVDANGRLTVVEYKSTPIRQRCEVTQATRVQLALQVMALRDMGHLVRGQEVYFTQHRTRVPVDLGPTDFAAAEALTAETLRTIVNDDAPPPLEDDPRCGRCSHIGVCLPDERALTFVHRRIKVADPDGQVLHLATPGSRASIRSGRVEIHRKGEQLTSVPIEHVQAVVVHGNIDLSGGLVRELLWRNLVVVWCTSRGRITGWAASATSPNGGPRHRQHVAAARGRLDLAREFIATKIANQATLLRRHGQAPDAVTELRRLQRAAQSGLSLPDLFGIEGQSASRYFADFSTMLNPSVIAALGQPFTARSRRPARDPVNAVLNYTYSLLLSDVIRAVLACGLDPHVGFLHSSERNKPALALDLMEEFRAVIADSVVIGAFNNGELKPRDFSDVLGAVSLREDARKKLIAAYERRIGSTFQHPLFGYTVTWRRAIEVQARLILGVIDGTQPEYKGIRVR